MALTISQVNQGFLALFGRPATGAEATKFAGQADVAALATALQADPLYTSELIASFPKIKTADLNAATDDAFVESLYGALIGRASDAEGKTFWLAEIASGQSREAVLNKFTEVLKAQAANGTADGVAYENIMSEDTSLVSAWVETLYQNLAARASDVEGLNYWTTQAIQNGGAAVIAAFTAALAAQGNTTEDGLNFAQKQGVADTFTNSFKGFNSTITANEKALVLGNLHTMMDGVNKDSQLDQYTEEIKKITNEYQDIKAVQFTKADDDDLGIDPNTGESNLNSAANFTGTYNLTDETKGTIQSNDRATGTDAYLTDTLSVNVTGYDKEAHPEFDLNNLPGTTSVEKLIINNGAATVTGSIGDDFQYVNVKGTGGFNITATKDLADVVLNSGSTKEGEAGNSFTGLNVTVTSLKTSAGNDTIAVGRVEKSINTGAGNDDVTAFLAAKATADLGAGNDTFRGYLDLNASLAGGAGDDTLNVTGVTNLNKGKAVSTIEIDGGTGNDKLDLSTGVYTNGQPVTDFSGIKTIKGVEALKVGEGTKLMASAISGQKMTLAGTSMTLNAKGSNGVDLSKMLNAEGEDVAVRVENVKSGNVNLAYGNKDFNNLKETIVLASDASKVNIKGFEQGDDFIEIDKAKVDNGSFFTKTLGENTGIDTKIVNANDIFFVDLKDKVSKADLNDLLDANKAQFDNLAPKNVFYIVATDQSGADNPNSTAKVYKVEVGKDHKVSKLDQISTINVADRKVLAASDFNDSPNIETTEYATTASGGTVNIANIGNVEIPGVLADGKTAVTDVTVSGGNSTQDVTVNTVAGKDVDVTFNSTNPGTADEGIAKSITLGAGNDNIVLAGSQRAQTADKLQPITIDGGAGKNTLTLGGNALENVESIKNIQTIDATTAGGLISAKALNGVSTTIKTDGSSLALWGYSKLDGGADSLDLKGLKSDGGNNDNITLNGLGNTKKIELNKDDAIAETIVLNKINADWDYPDGLTITGLASKTATVSDKISVAGLTTAKGAAGTGLAVGDGIIVTAADADKITVAEAKAAITSGTASGGAFIVAKDADSSAVYLVKADFTTSATSVDLVKLVSFDGVAEFSANDIVIG